MQSRHSPPRRIPSGLEADDDVPVEPLPPAVEQLELKLELELEFELVPGSLFPRLVQPLDASARSTTPPMPSSLPTSSALQTTSAFSTLLESLVSLHRLLLLLLSVGDGWRWLLGSMTTTFCWPAVGKLDTGMTRFSRVKFWWAVAQYFRRWLHSFRVDSDDSGSNLTCKIIHKNDIKEIQWGIFIKSYVGHYK